MIQFFIKIANNWVGKLLFAAILFGMVFVWGYGELTNTARYNNAAITVGNQSLSMQQLDELFRQEQANLSNMVGGQYISPKQAIEMGLLDNVIRQKTNEMIMDAIKEELGLTASNAAVQKYIERNPNFADAAGHFDRNLFVAYMRQMNTNERTLGKKLQSELASQHLMQALQAVAYTPAILVQHIYRSQHEMRDVTALKINIDKVKLDKDPEQQDLQDYYDVYAVDKFIMPEYRKFKYLRITPDMMLGRVEVTDAEIDLVFDERKDQFNTPEKRLVSQMYFTDEAKAKEVLSTVTADNFDKTAIEKLGQTPETTSFGYVAQNELAMELGDVVFKAQPNTVIGPVESTTGWHILLVKDIQAGKTMPTNEIRTHIRQQLAKEKTYDARNTLLRRVEDLLGEGKSLSEAVEALNLRTGLVEAVDISGNQKNGKALEGALANRELLQNLFTLQTGETSPTFESGDAVIIAELVEIIPVGTKPFEAVKDELKALWIRSHQQEKLQQIASQIVEQLHAGISFAEQKEITQFELVQEKGLTRDTTQAEIPAQALVEIFKQKAGLANATQIPVSDGMIISVIDQISYPNQAADTTATEKTVQELTTHALTEGVIETYTTDFGVSINTDSIKRIFSVYTSAQE